MFQGSSLYSLYSVWHCHHVTCHVSCQLSCHMLSRVQDLRTASHTLPEQCYYPFLISAAGRHTGRCLHNPLQPSNKLSLVPGMYLDSVDISRYLESAMMGGYRPAICPLCCTVCPLFSHGATQVLINLSNLSAMCHDQGWPFYSIHFILQGTFVSCESHSFENFFTTDYQHLLDSSNFQTIVDIFI